MRTSGMMARALCLLACLALAAAQCDPNIECCTPGTPQKGDDPLLDTGSFCTDKPFEPAYAINIGAKVPMVLNFVDYCTDQVLYTARFAVKVDTFSVINVPCTYDPAPCSSLPPEQATSCAQGQSIWTDPQGSYACSLTDGFHEKFVVPRICNPKNFGRGKNTTEYIWKDGIPSVSDMPAEGGSCRCNRTTLQNRTAPGANMTGVPDKFIKKGMSTFYTQLVVGGRSTSDAEDGCKCLGIDDTSEACMCMLGDKKIPFIYNNSYLPYLTALINIKTGGLLYKGAFVKWNFDTSGMGCVGCNPDNCWSVPKAGLDTWTMTGRDFTYKEAKMCTVAPRPDPNDPMAPYCKYPSSDKEISTCSLKAYIAWMGTDGFNHNCESNNEMFSRFTQMGVSSIAWQFYTGASNIATDVSRKVTTTSSTTKRLLQESVKGLVNVYRRWFGAGGRSREERV